jgi:hypothetical protein
VCPFIKLAWQRRVLAVVVLVLIPVGWYKVATSGVSASINVEIMSLRSTKGKTKGCTIYMFAAYARGAPSDAQIILELPSAITSFRVEAGTPTLNPTFSGSVAEIAEGCIIRQIQAYSQAPFYYAYQRSSNVLAVYLTGMPEEDGVFGYIGQVSGEGNAVLKYAGALRYEEGGQTVTRPVNFVVQPTTVQK